MATVRISKISATVTPGSTAKVRISRISATVTPPAATGPKVRISKISASVVAPPTAAPASRIWLNGAWRTPGARQVWLNGAWRATGQRLAWLNGAWHQPAAPAPTPPPVPALPGYTLTVADEFNTLDPTRWYARDNDTYGNPNGQIQRYMARNAVIGASSDGDGASLKLVSKREAVGGNPFTAGMLESQIAGWLAPLWHRKRLVCRIAHGQGVWQAWWSVAFNGGASMVELDDMEIFHTQVPGRALLTLHRATGRDSTGKLLLQKSVAKSKSADGYSGIFFEAPNATGGSFHEFVTEVTPVTDATGTTPGDPNLPSMYARFKGYIDGVKKFDYVDTNALFWTSNGGDPADPINRFWNIRLQGSQINGPYVGHPDDPLGYSRLLNACISINGGTAPNACATSFAGQPVLAPVFPNNFEIKSHTVWKWTG